MSIKESYEKALEVLKKNSTKFGFLASNSDINNYERVWSRDGVIQGLASLMSEDKDLIETFRKNLITLKNYQDETGRIASNIDMKKKDVSYGTLVGKIDATLWYVIGVGQYFKHTKDKKFLKNFIDSLDSAMSYLYSLELNGKGLLFIPTGGDWADEYITQGYVLFDQLLYLQALREYKYILKFFRRKTSQLNKKINNLIELIDINYFPSKNKKNNKFVYHKRLYEKLIKEYKKDYPLIYFSSSGFAETLDSFGCCLFLHLYKDKYKEKVIKSLVSRLKQQRVKILPAFWPPITSKDRLWYDLKNNSLFGFRNKPYFYHNGGLWPLIQGFFISALMHNKKKSQAKKYLKKFSEVLEKDNYTFHEFYDSKKYRPGGIERLGFSAAGYIIAYLSVANKKEVFKND